MEQPSTTGIGPADKGPGPGGPGAGGAVAGDPTPHRDHSQPSIAHRRFAATVNLNSADSGVGRLRFQEFSEHRHRPATGAAIVFPRSLLHEVMAIDQGTRFALLAFVYGDA